MRSLKSGHSVTATNMVLRLIRLTVNSSKLSLVLVAEMRSISFVPARITAGQLLLTRVNIGDLKSVKGLKKLEWKTQSSTGFRAFHRAVLRSTLGIRSQRGKII